MNSSNPILSGDDVQSISADVQKIDGVLYYREPARDQLLEIISKAACKSLRGLIVDSSVFWWEGSRIGHEGAATKLGVYFDKSDRLILEYKEGHPEIFVFSKSAAVHSKITALAIPATYERDDEPME